MARVQSEQYKSEKEGEPCESNTKNRVKFCRHLTELNIISRLPHNQIHGMWN